MRIWAWPEAVLIPRSWRKIMHTILQQGDQTTAHTAVKNYPTATKNIKIVRNSPFSPQVILLTGLPLATVNDKILIPEVPG